MKKLFLMLSVALMSTSVAFADEGMWLPSVISKARLKDMKSKNFKLSTEDIYSINKASLKDAIVLLSGCTGEFISSKGLVLTNHHCGYGQIQYHSSVEHDYLTNGFAAMDLGQELPSNNYWAKRLVRMDDVTNKVLDGSNDNMSDEELAKLVAENSKKVIAETINGTHYEAKIESLYYNNQYFIFVYEKFDDVRLVCAPPSAIGKFGGDTDNWMWPRHTGDFCIFRIYADKDNNPAAYSKDNVPYNPKRHLKISTKGVKEGDFTFIYGYPARTQEYLFSDAVKYIAEKGNPHKIALRDIRLNIIKAAMEQDKAVRIKYSAKTANIANAWKKWQGEAGGIVKLDAIGKKEVLEEKFATWAEGKREYQNVIPQFRKLYAALEPYAFVTDYINEAILGIEAIKFSQSLAPVKDKAFDMNKVKSVSELYFKDYVIAIDKAISVELLKKYVDNIGAEYTPEGLPKSKVDIENLVANLYNNSIFVSKERFDAVASRGAEEFKIAVENDPIFKFGQSFISIYSAKVKPEFVMINTQITKLYKNYMRGQMQMQPNREFYPDANSTLRVAYGKVTGFEPADGISYKPVTTIEGMIAKDNPEIYDYNVPQVLRKVYDAKDYGRWAVNGTVPVCILASNHTTGGNSGSPILNGKGELVGLNFDRCWESTMSDIIYDKDMCRNIGVDIRYVLFIVDKVCGASYLIDEMDLK